MKFLRSVPAVWVAWVIARLLIGYMILKESNPLGDVYYYHFGVFGDDPKALTEYPHAGVWPSTLLAWLIGDSTRAYFVAFPLMILCCDAAFMALVLRRPQPSGIDAAWLWVFFGTAAGQVFLLRLDLFPALLVAAAGYFLFKHPGFSGIVLAFATAMKLWPGVLAAGLIGSWKSSRTWLALAGFGLGLAGFISITVTTSGFERLISPLAYQQVRGLQIESVAATPFVVANFFEPGKWSLAYAPSKSFEITGPGIEQATAVASLVMTAAVVFAFAWAVYRFFRGRWTPESALAFFVLAILALLVGNKVFSTQYITWIGPILVVALAHDVQPRTQRGLIWALAICAVICAGLGTEVYPFGYDGIWKEPGTDWIPVAALAVRNGLILVMTLLALVWLALACRQPRRHDAASAGANYSVQKNLEAQQSRLDA